MAAFRFILGAISIFLTSGADGRETVELRGLQVLLSANDFFMRLVLISNGGGMGLRYWSATVIFLISFICLIYSSRRKGLTGLFKIVILLFSMHRCKIKFGQNVACLVLQISTYSLS